MSGAKMTDEILITALEENLADDPYGTAIYSIRNILYRALNTYQGSTNTTEHEALLAISRTVNEVDGPPRPA
jgi:hypothetical protein